MRPGPNCVLAGPAVPGPLAGFALGRGPLRYRTEGLT